MNIRQYWALVILFAHGTAGAASLRGSPESLAIQNQNADEAGLIRIANDTELEYLKGEHVLVPIPAEAVDVDERMPEKFRFVLPSTRRFLRELGYQFMRTFEKKLVITSAVRTQEYQNLLRTSNGNAAASEYGPSQSSHLTGATIDIGKKGLSLLETEWLRVRLLHFENDGYVEATEEFTQLVFHVMVLHAYGESIPNARRTNSPRE